MSAYQQEGAWLAIAGKGLPAVVACMDGQIRRASQRLGALDALCEDAGHVDDLTVQGGRDIRNERMRLDEALRVLLEAREHIKRAQAVLVGMDYRGQRYFIGKEHSERLPLVGLDPHAAFKARVFDPADQPL